jgi:hypothetical protein
MALTPKQKALYWRTWSKVRKSLVELGDYSAEDADAQRHELHCAALGANKSSTDFNNRDLDAVLDHFQSILVLTEGPQSGPARAEAQPCKRLIYAIHSLGLPEPYIEAICRDEFQTSDWRTLSEPQLTRLRFTLTSRARKKSAR